MALRYLIARCSFGRVNGPLGVILGRCKAMAKVTSSIPLTDLQQDASSALKRVRRSKRPLVVTERGKAAAVLLSINAYERREKEREILRLLALGEAEIAAGEGYDLDDVLTEADKLLKKL